MPQSDQWTRLQLRNAVRRELMDPNGSWWTDNELNNYLTAWQDRVNDELEFTWGTASAVIGPSTTTVTIADIADDVLRPAFVCWNNRLLSPLLPQELDIIERAWRNSSGGDPVAVYFYTYDEMCLFPPVSTEGTLSLEYPASFTFSNDNSTIKIPPWTKYSAIDYCAFRAYSRNGPNMDINRALMYKGSFNNKLSKFKKIKRGYLPEGYGSFVPGNEYERRIVDPVTRGVTNVAIVSPTTLSFADEVPTGSVNGSNNTFFLSHPPSPSVSLKLFLDGVLLKKDTHYTLSGGTITFLPSYVPVAGQTLFASYTY